MWKVLTGCIQTVKGITDLGAYAIIDPHNFGR